MSLELVLVLVVLAMLLAFPVVGGDIPNPYTKMLARERGREGERERGRKS